MKTINTLLFCLLSTIIWGQNPGIIADNAEIKRVATGYSFTEGPAVNSQGQVFFTDQPNDRIHVWNENKGITLWLEGTERSNGMYFDANNQLVACADLHNRIVRFDAQKNIEVQTNGLIGTPDGKTLYVADINDRKIWKYSIQEDGSLANRTFFAPQGSDGMTIDQQGNIYLTMGKVWVYSPEGELIEAIELPESPSNVCFGGKERDILFITARTSVYTLKMNTTGVQ